MHAFAREVKLTEAEYDIGIDFSTALARQPTIAITRDFIRRCHRIFDACVSAQQRQSGITESGGMLGHFGG